MMIMNKNLFKLSRRVILMVLSVMTVSIIGCASTPPSHSTRAPVEDRVRPGSQSARTPTSTAVATAGGYHVVSQGETLYAIARMYNVTVADIVSGNQLADANQISVGQRLLIPGGGGSRTTIVQPTGGGQTTVTTTPVSSDGPRETTPAKTTATATSSNWAWPVENGQVVTKFGANGAKGIEIAAPMGTPVLAAESGKVIFSSNNIRGYGNLIVIRHDSEFLTAYGYNSQLLVKEGDTVKKGDKIATVGASGTDSPKLHFEIRNAQSKPEDPLLHLPKR